MKNNKAFEHYFLLLLAYLLFFAADRVVFFLVFRGASAYSFGELFRAFLIGARLDLSLAALFAGAVFVPLYALAQWPRAGKAAIRCAQAYYAALNAVFVLLAVAEFPFYREYASRLNHLFFEYFANPKELFVTLEGIRWVWPMTGLFLLLGAAGAWAGAKFSARLFRREERPALLPSAARLILLAGLTVVFIRGGFQRRPINWGEAFFSGDHFLNQTALNGSYNLFQCYQIYLEEKSKDTPRMEYFKPAEALALSGETYGAPLHKPDGLLALKPGAPGKPNIVLVFMESFSPEHVGVFGSAEGLTPEFDRLSREGLLFTHFYSNGTRTSRAMVAALSSFPPLPGVNLTKKIQAQQPMPTAASYLSELGYRCAFMYGGDKNFEDMGGFAISNGFHAVYDKENFRPFSRDYNPIGVYDEELFEGAAEELDKLPQPFFASIMTLTNHGPFILPKGYTDAAGLEKEKRTFKYSDYALGRFIELAKKRGYFKNTIFFIMADHPIHYGAFSEEKFHIPLLAYSPLLLKTGHEGRLGSQLDLAPTFLWLAGSRKEQNELPFWGQPLPRRNPDVPVFCLEDPYFGVIGGKYLYREGIAGGEGALLGPGNIPVSDATAEQERMARQARAAAQVSGELFFEGKAGKPWKR